MEHTLVRVDKETAKRLKELAEPQTVASYLRTLSLQKETVGDHLENIEALTDRQVNLLIAGDSIIKTFIDINIAPGFADFFQKNLNDVADEVGRMRDRGEGTTDMVLKHPLDIERVDK